MERAAAAREAAAGEAGTSGPSAVSRGPSCRGPSCSAPSGAQSESFWCGSSAVAQPAAAAPSDRDESTCGAGEGGAAAAEAGEGRAAATEDGEPAADASEAGGGAGSFLRSGTSPRSPDVRERQRGSSDDGAAGGAGEAVLRPGWSKRSFLASRERRGPGCAGRLPAVAGANSDEGGAALRLPAALALSPAVTLRPLPAAIGRNADAARSMRFDAWSKAASPLTNSPTRSSATECDPDGGEACTLEVSCCRHKAATCRLGGSSSSRSSPSPSSAAATPDEGADGGVRPLLAPEVKRAKSSGLDLASGGEGASSSSSSSSFPSSAATSSASAFAFTTALAYATAASTAVSKVPMCLEMPPTMCPAR
mmetsp:Transcript_15264/g.50763  ORF Transcript_15264/g.50763 Transcript_15264/m.50763 type:complete len:365 (-) Transcript_15264:88-1182(-)